MTLRIALVRATVLPGLLVEEERLADSLACGYLHAWLERVGYRALLSVNPVLENLDADAAADKVIAFAPALVGVSVTFQWQSSWLAHFASRVRVALPAVHIVGGGIFATSAWHRLLTDVTAIDSVCRHEGEVTLTALARCLTGVPGLACRGADGVPRANRRQPRLTDLTVLPFPARFHLPAQLARGGVIQMESGRGCNAHCTFCDMRRSGWIGRPVCHVVDELETLVTAWPGHPVWFVDSTFLGFGPRRFARGQALAREILRRGLSVRFVIEDRAENVDHETFALLQQAGLVRVYLGIESFAAGPLERWQKHTTVATNLQALAILGALGLPTQIGLILFDDTTSLDEIGVCLAGMRQAIAVAPMLHLYNLHQLIPYEGTYLARQYQHRYGYPPDVHDVNLWRFTDPRVGIFRDRAWAYLEQIWPVTAVVFDQLDSSGWQADLAAVLAVKNRLLLDFLEALLVALWRSEAATVEVLCQHHLGRTRTALRTLADRTAPAVGKVLRAALAG
ncbi:MAG: radical SAM protein [Rhodospirillaceae bacterium]|nr:MAG: radical SAM protein [Rhodospirillaceae bacterium]